MKKFTMKWKIMLYFFFVQLFNTIALNILFGLHFEALNYYIDENGVLLLIILLIFILIDIWLFLVWKKSRIEVFSDHLIRKTVFAVKTYRFDDFLYEIQNNDLLLFDQEGRVVLTISHFMDGLSQLIEVLDRFYKNKPKFTTKITIRSNLLNYYFSIVLFAFTLLYLFIAYPLIKIENNIGFGILMILLSLIFFLLGVNRWLFHRFFIIEFLEFEIKYTNWLKKTVVYKKKDISFYKSKYHLRLYQQKKCFFRSHSNLIDFSKHSLERLKVNIQKN